MLSRDARSRHRWPRVLFDVIEVLRSKLGVAPFQGGCELRGLVGAVVVMGGGLSSVSGLGGGDGFVAGGTRAAVV